jgi:hypothetical protein
MEILNMTNRELLELGTEIGKLMAQAYADKDWSTWDSLKIELEEVYSKLK